MNARPPQPAQFTRRKVVAATGALTALTIVPRHVLGAAGQPAPIKQMNFGCVSVGGMRGANDVRSVGSENSYALCDVDEAQVPQGLGTAGRDGLSGARRATNSGCDWRPK